MTVDDQLLEAKLADCDRDLAAAESLRRTLADLYGPCRCAPRAASSATTCERHAVDPGLFRRLVWSGLGV
jgi:hypothetical protein